MRKWEDDLIEEELKEYPRYGGITANVVAIREVLNTNNLNPNKSTVQWVIKQIESKLADGLMEVFGELENQTGIASNTANQNILLAELAEAGQPATLGNLTFLAEQLESELAVTPRRAEILRRRKCEVDEIQEAKDIRNELLSRLTDGNGRPRPGLGSATVAPVTAYRNECQRINSLSFDELRAIHQKRQNAAKLQNSSVEELRVRARHEFQATHPPQGQYLPLPPTFVPFGKDESCGVPWSAGLIKRLDSRTIRYLTERHSFEVINEILNGTRR